ncbi:MAG: thiamine pyrophosphate-binding protein [Dehalococcoidia bacterium]|nr:thiamine pyrophosphate-binding protein [Dehalococcoidia bacterium]
MPSDDTLTGSHLIGETLKTAGVSTVFTLAGDHNLPLLDALADMDFRIIDTRHEAAAVHMADGWARVTGEPGVVTYTTPGFANGIPGLSSAMYSEAPLLSISGSAPLGELGQGAMQEIDQIGMAKPVTKSAAMVTDGRRIPDMIAEALRLAYSGRRGPVHLTVPIDIQEREVATGDVAVPQSCEYRPDTMTAPTDEQIKQVVTLLKSAERPLIIAGSAASYAGSGDVLQRLIETTRIPLMTESSARGLVSDNHPYSIGFYDNGLNRAARKLREADVILLLGMKQDIIIGYTRPPTVSPDAKIVQVDPSPGEIGRNREVAVGIVGDIDDVAARMTAEAARHTWCDRPWLDELRGARAEQVAEMDVLAQPSVPIHALHVHKALLSLIDEDDFLVFDGGDFCHWGRAYLPARTPRTWSYFSGLGMLGTAISTAMAAKLAHPDRRAIVISGDGAFGFNALEYDTAVRHGIAITTVLGNDASWGIDRQIQLQVYGKPVATDLLPIRYDRLVESLGGEGLHVQDPADLPSALDRALNSGRPSLVNVEIQRAISPRGQAAVDRWRSAVPQPF